jgi:hypothetical protein
VGVAIGSLVAWVLIQWDVNVFGAFIIFLVLAGGYVAKLIMRLIELSVFGQSFAERNPPRG